MLLALLLAGCTSDTTATNAATGPVEAFGPPARLVFLQLPDTRLTLEGPFEPEPQVGIYDAQGRLVADSSLDVTLALGTESASTFELRGLTTARATVGVARFPGLSVALRGLAPRGAIGSLTLMATSGELTSDPSDPRPVELLPLLLQGVRYLPGGSNVASADFDGDSHLDIAAAELQNQVIRVSFGFGDGTFTAVPDLVGVAARPVNLACADLDADGDIDIVTANQSDSVSVLLGNGDGTFLPPALYAAPGRPTDVAVGDINGDGRPDLVVSASGASAVLVFLGTVGATFDKPLSYPAGGSPGSVAVGDANGDHRLDVAVANADQNSVGLLYNTSFGLDPPLALSVGISPADVVIADLDGDGFGEIVSANEGASSLTLFPGQAGRLLPTGLTLPANRTPTSVVVADLNGDGLVDLATSSDDGVTFLQNDGFGFLAPVTSQACLGIQSLVLGDFDEDGRLDGLAASSVNLVSLSFGKGDGTFQTSQSTLFSSLAAGMAQADFDGNGSIDVALAMEVQNPSTAPLIAWLGQPEGPPVQVASSMVPRPSASGIAAGNLDADGHLDLVMTSADGGVYAWKGKGDGSFSGALAATAGAGATHPALGDVNGDGKLDVLVANSATADVSVLLGNGDGTLQSPVNWAVGRSPVDCALADSNEDGNLDIIALISASAQVVVLLGEGDGTFGLPIRSQVDPSPAELVHADSLAVADLDLDGKVDCAVGRSRDGLLDVLTGRGDGAFSSPVAYSAGASPTDVGAADLNGDGLVDLAVSSSLDSAAWVLLRDLPGNYVIREGRGMAISQTAIGLADLNGDGSPDLCTAGAGGFTTFLSPK